MKQQNRLRLVACAAAVLCAALAPAQMLSREPWEQKNLLGVKMSQLYYELNVGINVRPQQRQADFVYFAFGYGKPTKLNAWRKFLPEREVPATLTPRQQELVRQSGTDDLYAGKIGVGWNHWFNHVLGLYALAGWGFVADLATSSDLPDDIIEQLDSSDKGTFVYNTVPVELGLTVNLWQHCHVQAGVTYQWKEIPLLTVGIGYAF